MLLFTTDLGEELTCLCWDGRTALVGGGSGALSLWDLRRGVALRRDPSAHPGGAWGGVTALATSPCGRWAASGGGDRRVVVWTNRELERLGGEDDQ